MIKKTLWVGLTLVLALVSAGAARADEWNKKTVLTFSQPFEIPGHVLPAGTYTFQLADSQTDRHIVQISNADGSEIIATVMTIPDYRLKPTDETLIRFREVPSGSPEVIRAWFYPGNSIGQEFVYPKARATQLAKAAKAVVPAMAVDAADAAALKSAPIVAITPDETEMPVAAAIQTTAGDAVASAGSTLESSPTTPAATGTSGTMTAPTTRTERELPSTASPLALIALLGCGCFGLALGLRVFGKRATVPVDRT